MEEQYKYDNRKRFVRATLAFIGSLITCRVQTLGCQSGSFKEIQLYSGVSVYYVYQKYVYTLLVFFL